MLATRVTVGGATVLASGSVVVALNQPVRIWPFPGNSYFVEFRFIDDATESRISWYGEDGGWILELKNFHGEYPVSNTAPLYVANHNRKKIMANVAVLVVGRAPMTRLLSFTLFEGEALG